MRFGDVPGINDYRLYFMQKPHVPLQRTRRLTRKQLHNIVLRWDYPEEFIKNIDKELKTHWSLEKEEGQEI